MKSIEEIDTLLELADNEVPVNYNSLINTFKNDKFIIKYENKQYVRRAINCPGTYTTMLEVHINEIDEINKMIVILMVHNNNHNYRHDIDKKKDSVLIVYIRCGEENLFNNSKYINY